MPNVAVSVHRTEQAVIGVLMTSPTLRGEVVQKYPARFESFFSTEEARKLLRAVMSINGMAYPSSVDPLVPDLLDTEWSPLRVFDNTGFDEKKRFWQNVEHLRRFAKRRDVRDELKKKMQEVQDPDTDIDLVTAEASTVFTRLVAGTSMRHDPTMEAGWKRYEQAKVEGTLGRRISTGIKRLDDRMRGGLRSDPGELVVIAGREKQRKTTLTMNIVSAWHRGGEPGATVWICNEQSMDTVQLIGHLWALEATRLAYISFASDPATGVNGNPWCFSKDDVLDTEKHWAAIPQAFLNEAERIVRGWNIRFYCAAADDGNAMDAESVCSLARTDIEFNQAKRVIVDNLQGFRHSDEDDYAVMNRVVPLIDQFTGVYKTLTIALSQLSRKSGTEGGQIKGGGGLEGRANLILETEYDDEKTPKYMGVKRTWGRNVQWFQYSDLQLEPNSGLIYDGQDYAPKPKVNVVGGGFGKH